MKPSLQFRLSQHLTLTPQLQQSIRLLQLSTVELNQEIDRLLMENPVLEREDDDEGGGAARRRRRRRRRARQQPTSAPGRAGAGGDRLVGRHRRRTGAAPATTTRTATATSAPPTRRRCATTCAAQLSLTNLGERDRALVELLIDALDEDGYLTQPLEEIAALLPAEAEVELEELAIALRHLQNLEPAGVGARSPGECLCLQLRVPCEGDDAPRAQLALRDRREAPRAAREPRLHAPEERHRRERGRAARGAAPDPGAQPAPGRGVRAASRRATWCPT